MTTFQLIINCSEKNISKNYIIDCIKVPRDSTLSSLLKIFELFLNNINNNLNTVEKCLKYMFKTSTGPFINNYIDISYKINYIDINTTGVNNSIGYNSPPFFIDLPINGRGLPPRIFDWGGVLPRPRPRGR